MPLDDPLNDWPALFVPTYPPPGGFGVDTGLARPVPGGIPYYLCWAIQPLSAYQPGAPFSCKVTIGNWQGGNSDTLARVELWWSEALSGKTIPLASRYIGFASVEVPPHGGQRTTRVLSTVMPVDAPPHICLLAKVWHALDRAPRTLIDGVLRDVADPIHDRHWAQHNLMAVKSSGPQTIQFLATNPGDKDASYDLLVRPISQEMWPVLARQQDAEPVNTRALVQLSDERGTEGQGINVLERRIELAAGEERRITLTVELFEPLRERSFAAYEVLQSSGDRLAGGFALVLQGDA